MDSSKLNQLLELQERLANSPALQAAVDRLTKPSPALQAAMDRLTKPSPALQAAMDRLTKPSPALQAAVDRLTKPSPALQAAMDRLTKPSPALQAAMDRLTKPSPALQAAMDRLTKPSPALQAAMDRLTKPSPALQAAMDRLTKPSPALQAAMDRLTKPSPALQATMEIPRLTPELFGEAWNERLAEAVGRLEEAQCTIADSPEPERAVEDLVADAATVQEAAPPEAQESVNTWVRVFVFWLADKFLADPALEAVLPLIITLLVVVTPPDPPTAPELSTSTRLEPVTTALILPGAWSVDGLPPIVQRAGPMAAERVVEFFTAQIRNVNTREAYGKAVTQFFTWCDEHGLELEEISPVAVATYVEEIQGVYRAPTIKQHLAAIRRLFDWLVVGQVVPWNPTAAVRGPTHVVKMGKTPVLQPGEVRLLLDSIDTSAIGGLRDRALMGVMIYTFARVSAVVNMDVDDYYQQGKRWWLRLREKGGKHHALPVHHKAEAYLDAYLADAGIEGERGSPLWRSLTRTRELGERRMSRVDVFRMVKRRVKSAELGVAANCHTFRASGITAYLLNGGTLERAQAIAGHESPRTTQLYDRTADDITLEDIERIRV